MFDDYKLLNTQPPEQSTWEYYHPDTLEVISLETSALEVMADFHTKTPVTVFKKTNADEALKIMIHEKVRALLVINDHDHVLGIVNSQQIQGTKRTQVAQQEDIKPVDVTVDLLMTPISHMPMLNFNTLSNALVGHIARIFYDQKVTHVLVYETNADETICIRGIFSASFIGRKLGMEIRPNLYAESISDIQKSLD